MTFKKFKLVHAIKKNEMSLFQNMIINLKKKKMSGPEVESNELHLLALL